MNTERERHVRIFYKKSVDTGNGWETAECEFLESVTPNTPRMQIAEQLFDNAKEMVCNTLGLSNTPTVTPQKTQSEPESVPTAPNNAVADSDKDTLLCTGRDCKTPEKPISKRVHDYSMDKFRQPLCFECQQNARGK